MVVFTCNHCGESLQKPKVEKHYNVQCRKSKSLTCVDCFKDFKGEEYVVHTKCITEEERYAAKGSIPGGVVKKGEVKQESWVNMVKSIVLNEKNLKPSLKNLFDTISNYSNVPRKKAKFINFLKSSSGGRVNFNDIEAAWNLIEKYKNSSVNNNSNGSKPDEKHKNSSLNDSASNSEVIKNGVKHKVEDDEVPVKKKQKIDAESSNIDTSESDKFSFKNTILNILNEKGKMSCKKLQKKFLKIYIKETGNTECIEKTIKKYNSKLKKLSNVKVSDDGFVTLVN